MKAFLPWLLVLGLGVALGWQFTVNQQQRSELSSARIAAEQLEALRQEFEIKQEEYAGVTAELERTRKDSKDLLRLRNEVVQLRKERQQLTQQMATAQTQVQSAQQQALVAQQANITGQALQPNLQGVQQTGQPDARARFMQRYGLQQTPEQQQAMVCQNNLRLLQGAKQQWALEHNQAQGAPVDMAALKNHVKEAPACPSGGSYILGSIGTPPTCTVQGHAMSLGQIDSPAQVAPPVAEPPPAEPPQQQ